MSTKKTQPEALTPEQVAMVFEEIASTAVVVEDLSGMLLTNSVGSLEDEGTVTTAIQLLTRRIGLLAELYGPRCGANRPILVKGEADAWLMPRSFSHAHTDVLCTVIGGRCSPNPENKSVKES